MSLNGLLNPAKLRIEPYMVMKGFTLHERKAYIYFINHDVSNECFE